MHRYIRVQILTMLGLDAVPISPEQWRLSLISSQDALCLLRASFGYIIFTDSHPLLTKLVWLLLMNCCVQHYVALRPNGYTVASSYSDDWRGWHGSDIDCFACSSCFLASSGNTQSLQPTIIAVRHRWLAVSTASHVVSVLTMRQFDWRWLYGSVWVSALHIPVGVDHR